jgi:hypothetical protein
MKASRRSTALLLDGHVGSCFFSFLFVYVSSFWHFCLECALRYQGKQYCFFRVWVTCLIDVITLLLELMFLHTIVRLDSEYARRACLKLRSSLCLRPNKLAVYSARSPIRVEFLVLYSKVDVAAKLPSTLHKTPHSSVPYLFQRTSDYLTTYVYSHDRAYFWPGNVRNAWSGLRTCTQRRWSFEVRSSARCFQAPLG